MNYRTLITCILLLASFTIVNPVVTYAQAGDEISFAVKKEGRGKPMIFIHGLDCSGEVWNDAVSHFKNRYTCYTITLPGFAGQPPLKSASVLKTVAGQLAMFIHNNKLNRPVIVGHSLGGWLALQFGILYPDLAGDIICVSSAPFLPALSMGSGISVDSASKIGLLIKNGMASQTPQQVRQSSKYILGAMMQDSAKIAWVTEMSAASDQPTQGEVMYELFSTDLRSQVANIKSRILVLGDWIGYKQYGATRESVYNSYKDQFKLASQVTIAINDNSKHFIMFDEPQWFYKQADDFLMNK